MDDSGMRELIDDEEVRAASNDHPLIAHTLPYRVAGGASAFADGGAVALRYDYWDAPSWIALGPDEDVARLVPTLPRASAEEHIAVPRTSAATLSADITPWGFGWRDKALGTPFSGAAWLPASAANEIDALLDASFPHASTRPSSLKARRWAGVRDDEGRLIACIVDSSGSPDVGFVASLTVAVPHRGRGLGEALLGWTADELLRDHPRVGLWYEGNNTHAIAIYERLGFALLPIVSGAR
jgi:ribosomal protein S18 acetylase RimI-like enzyme